MVSGITLGGFSEGFNRAQKRGLQKQRLGLQSRALDINEQELTQKKLRQQMTRTSETLGKVTEAIANLRAQGQEPGPELLTTARGLASQLDRFSQMSGLGGSPGSAMIEAALQAPRELTDEETFAKSLPNLQQSLSEAGVETSTSQLAQAAGITPKPEQPKLVEALVNGEQVFLQQSFDDNGNIILDQVDSAAKPVPSGLSFRVNPDGSVEVASGGAQLTGSSQSAEQETQRQTQELLSNLQNLENALEEGGRGVVGLPGAIQGLVNVTVAQAIPETFDQDRSEFERTTKIIRQSALRIVSDESRFSEADRDFIFELFPSAGPFESVQSARDKIRIMQAFFARRLLQSAERTDTESVDIPDLSMDEIVNMVTSGSITEQEGRRLVELLSKESGE